MHIGDAHILLVDDNSLNLLVAQELLKPLHGYFFYYETDPGTESGCKEDRSPL